VQERKCREGEEEEEEEEEENGLGFRV